MNSCEAHAIHQSTNHGNFLGEDKIICLEVIFSVCVCLCVLYTVHSKRYVSPLDVVSKSEKLNEIVEAILLRITHHHHQKLALSR